MKDAIIRVLNLTKYYGKFLAVDHINLAIHDGEIFGFLGPNGAGKTTTLLMLTTVIKPSEGTAVICGYDIRKEPHKVRELIGIAFQEPKLYWMYTPMEALIWHAKVCGYSGNKAYAIVKEVLKRLDMWDARNKKSFELSGGMKKRVEVAKVLIQRPKVAIFDEPTAQIDVSGKHVVWDAIKELRDEGSTIILATNELYEADILSDRIGIMHRGKLVALDTPSKLKDQIPGGDVLEIVLEDRRLSIVNELYSFQEVKDVRVEDGKVKVFLNKVEEVLPKIFSSLLSKGISIKSVNVREPSLDEVFMYFVGHGGGEKVAGEA